MRIAFIDVTTTVFAGGIQTAVWQLAMSLADLGHEITIYGGVGEIRPDLGGRAITIHTFPFTPRKKFPNFGTRFRKLAERLSFGINARTAVITACHDWVILTKPFDFFWPYLMPKGHPTQFAFMSGGTDFFLGDKFLVRKVNALMACSYFNAWQVSNRLKRQAKVIYNGVNVGHFCPMANKSEMRQKLGLPEGEIVITYAGRIVGWKGIGVALRALSLPILRDMRLRMVIIGDGSDKPRLIELADQLRISDRVTFHSVKPHRELPAWYGISDIGIFPSIADEAFGITIAEAMACGLPVIGSYIGGIPEVIGNEGNAGLLVPAADSQALAQAIARLAGEKELRTRMGTNARQRIASQFTWHQAAQRMLDALNS